MRIEFVDSPRNGQFGDYFIDNELVFQIRNGDYVNNMLVLIHEMIEYLLCVKSGVSIEAIDEWDEAHKDAEEPGELEGSPYKYEHAFAESIERLILSAINKDWKLYEKELEDACKPKE